ncbi:hypothetical protein CPB86DRAFT_625031 [Serendipita vermifera]|nr:hypothetical protein CPB86DRAFT_625031 [Serendipita vermifera]
MSPVKLIKRNFELVLRFLVFLWSPYGDQALSEGILAMTIAVRCEADCHWRRHQGFGLLSAALPLDTVQFNVSSSLRPLYSSSKTVPNKPYDHTVHLPPIHIGFFRLLGPRNATDNRNKGSNV